MPVPKIELHVHLEGTIRAKTLLAIARRNGMALPADTVQWIDYAPVAPVEIEVATIGWLALGCFLAVGVSLFGSGIGSALRRR